MKRTLILLTLVFSLTLLVAVAGCTSESEPAEPAAETETQESTPEEAEPAETETDPDMALVESKCSLCHTTERVYAADYDRATWEATVDRMKANGLVITDEEYEQVVAYLSGE
jgi:cytochrome c5